MQAALCLVLVAHLPRVPAPAPGAPPTPQESWLPRAVADAYLPLIAALRSRDRGAITLACSPELIAMLDEERWRDAIEDDLQRRLEHHRHHAAYDPLQADRAWHAEAAAALAASIALWETLERDLPGAFAALAAAGRLELLPAATGHGLLPLMHTHALRCASIQTAQERWRERFSLEPRGLWLPERAWDDATDAALAACGVEYTVVGAAALQRAAPAPVLGDLAPVLSTRGVTCFGAAADPARSLPLQPPTQDGPRSLPEISATCDPEAPRGPTSAADARQRAVAWSRLHAARAADALAGAPATWEVAGRAPVLTAAWRAEALDAAVCGDAFLQGLFDAAEDGGLELMSLGRAASAWPRAQVVAPAASSGAPEGAFQPWVDPGSAWLHRHLHRLEHQVAALTRQGEDDRRGPLQSRDAQLAAAALTHLLHASSADLSGLLAAGLHVRWAAERARAHLVELHSVLEQLRHRAPQLARPEDRPR